MRAQNTLRGMAAAVGVAVGVLLAVASGAMAAGLQVCVPEKEGAVLKTPKAGVCKAKYTKSELPSEEEATILAHMAYQARGVGGKPTIQFSGVNVQVVNGEGKTASINGEGNLVIGYDEDSGKGRGSGKPGAQTGSHDLILGEEQEFSSYGGILAGDVNTISAPFASVSGGLGNNAIGPDASVTGGIYSTASGQEASVSGGDGNTASEEFASVSGGSFNHAEANAASVTGGAQNHASGTNSSVSGGFVNAAGGGLGATWVGGGYKNTAEFNLSSIFGGKELKTATEYEAIP